LKIPEAAKTLPTAAPRGRATTGSKDPEPGFRRAGHSRALLGICGVAITLAVSLWCLRGEQTHQIPWHLGLFGLSFTAYLLALRVSRDLSAPELRVALVAAVAWRLALAWGPPLVSNDVNRYVWEGRIQLHGGNPYAWPDRPEAEKWAGLRDEVWRGINHKDYAAVYPPVWQLAARAVVGLADSVVAMKGFAVGCEILSLWLLARVLKSRGLPRQRLLIMAWSPLALVEIAGGGHNEALGMLFLVASLASLQAEQPLLSAVAAWLGFATKFLPGLVGLAWWRNYRWWHGIAGLVLIGLVLVPYTGAEVGWLSLIKYARFWTFNETLFSPLTLLVGSHEWAIVASGAILVLLALGLGWRRSDPAASALTIVIASLVLAPNVLPWYALWLLPLLVLRDEPGALLFTGTVQLAYLVYPPWLLGQSWHVGWGLRVLEYGPCLLSSGILALRRPGLGRDVAGSRQGGLSGPPTTLPR